MKRSEARRGADEAGAFGGALSGPMPECSIRPLDLSRRELLERLHALQRAAYAQEASLLGVGRFAPLERSLEDLEERGELFLGAFVEGELVGALGHEPDDAPETTLISSLVVDPTWQRRGIARRLVDAALARFGERPVTVSTAVANLPALALYRQLGFVPGRRRVVGDEPIEIVKLRREASPRQGVAQEEEG